MQRRQILKAGVMGAAAVGLGVSGYQYLPPSANTELRATREIVAQLFRSVNTDRIRKLVVDYHHPLRSTIKLAKWSGRCVR